MKSALTTDVLAADGVILVRMGADFHFGQRLPRSLLIEPSIAPAFDGADPPGEPTDRV
ncbi:hypothetical protein ACO2RV_03730 [Ancylobacter sp. VNQ12]|uniref:hypothetical protein n=1 Tax=Ancylobacter sp. VNQ12 TaxID=3400920 RepID=UPI003BFB81C2